MQRSPVWVCVQSGTFRSQQLVLLATDSTCRMVQCRDTSARVLEPAITCFLLIFKPLHIIHWSIIVLAMSDYLI
jgi:hypothetical protein